MPNLKALAVRLTVTNSRNDDVRVEWYFCENTAERDSWKADKQQEEDKWNYHTAGAVSTRFYDFQDYFVSEMVDFPMSEFEGMKLRDFLNIIAYGQQDSV